MFAGWWLQPEVLYVVCVCAHTIRCTSSLEVLARTKQGPGGLGGPLDWPASSQLPRAVTGLVYSDESS